MRSGTALSEIFDPADGRPGRMLRKEKWKVWEYEGDADPVLFDLETDPDEEHDRGTDPEYRNVRRSLLALLRRNWHPARVREIAEQKIREYRFLSDWGRKVTPTLQETTTVSKENQFFEKLNR